MSLLSDLSIATICLGSSAYLYLIQHRRTNLLASSKSPSAGYVLTNQVVHARLLPLESKHAFTYPTLSLLLSVSALESGALNQASRGWVFGYPGLFRICGLRPETYLTDYSGSASTIRGKLVRLLEASKVELGEVWMMTMPSFLGFEGINPLTVYFCYKNGQDRVWGVVLEVHNTFGERHAYVLQVGKGEDQGDRKLKGYDHQWTFPRQFHVSPFNDRAGHYVCSVVVPSHPPPSTTSTTSVTPPRPTINLHLLTAPPLSQLKLTALLRPVISEPLTTSALLGALVLPPFTSSTPRDTSSPAPASWASLPLGAGLLLTSLRIVYHAARLHYQRGLAVFARPEPVAGVGREWVEKALGGVWNDVQPAEEVIGGGIGWQSESSTERWARERFETRFGEAATLMYVRIKIACADPSVPITTLGAKDPGRELALCYRSSRTWSSLLLAPTAKDALEIGSHAEKWFVVSDEQLFAQLWEVASLSSTRGLKWPLTLVQSIRSRFAHNASSTTPSFPQSAHPLDVPSPYTLLFHVSLLYLTFHAEHIVSDFTRARFVRGDAPWRVWDRIGREPRVGSGGIGSVIE